MRPRLRLLLLIALFTLGVFPRTSAPAFAAPRGSGQIVAREVTSHPQPAAGAAVLSMDPGVPAGLASTESIGSTGGGTLLYESPVIAADQLFDRIGVHWTEAMTSADQIAFDLRTSSDGATWSDWSPVTDDDDMYDGGRNEHYGAPLPASAGARFAQYRAWLPNGDTTALEQVGLTFMDVSDLNQGPLVTLLNDVRGAIADLGESYASAAPVGASKVLTRADWGADESLMNWAPEYQRVQKAIVHHTAGDDGGTNVAATIRAIYYFHAVTRGWGDIGYNYLVDKYGNIWTGRSGGDNVVGGHAYGWNYGSFGVAAIGTFTSIQPTSAMVGAIANIIAMKFAQFGIAPYGADTFTHKEQRTDGTWVPVTSNPPNIQGHRDSNYIVGATGGQTECPGNMLWAQLPNIRSLAQAAVNNGYTNLVALDPVLPKAGLAGAVIQVPVTVRNIGRNPIPAGTLVSYKILVKSTPYVNQGGQGTITTAIPAGGSALITVPLTVPAIGNYILRWDLETNGSWWYTLYNNPFRDIAFRSADWSADWVSDTVPGTWFAGQTASASVTVTNDGGRPWTATGVDPVVLGYRWIDDATGVVTVGKNFANLAADVQAGQTATITIPITAPLAPANYTMELDLYKQNEFWFKDKGIPADPTPIGVGLDFHATYSVGTVPTIGLGQSVTVPVTIANTGQGTFPTLIGQPVDLGYHWYTQAGALVVWDGLRTRLPADLPHGQSVTVQAQVQSPPNGGAYTLRFDLAQEGVAWFSTKGVATSTTPVTICCGKVFGATYQPQITTLAVSGALQSIPITVTNSGNFTWNAGGANPVDLSYHWMDAAGKTVLWDGLRTKLTADVPAGGTQTLQAQLQFPSAGGTYTLKWDMVQEGVSWFSGQGVATFNQSVTVQSAVAPPPTAGYGASYDVSAVPASLPTEMRALVAVTVKNSSTFAWGPGINLSYHLYNATGQLVTWDGLRTPLAIGAGQTATVKAQIGDPLTAGTYTLKFDVVQEGVAWFSDKGVVMASRTVTVTVPQYGMVFTAAPVSVTLPANGNGFVSLGLKNTGSLPWQASQLYDISYHITKWDGTVVQWDGIRTALPDVAPGQTVTVNVAVHAPAAGPYVIHFDVVREGVTWFSGQGVPTGDVALTAQ
jgi:N-acetylmuramoyl-L-alanine amidase-like protein